MEFFAAIHVPEKTGLDPVFIADFSRSSKRMSNRPTGDAQ